MLGFMNEEAYERSLREKRVTFYSRTKGRLWTKGETSGHFLEIESTSLDCDRDTLLVRARPMGPVCHTGTPTCFADASMSTLGFLAQLERIIAERRDSGDSKSYTASLFAAGTNRIAQKVGEEALEVAIASKDEDEEAFLGECADLVFHLLVLLRHRSKSLDDVVAVLKHRHEAK